MWRITTITYRPILEIYVDNYSKKFLLNSELQKYIDEATNNLDLFSKEEAHFTKTFGNIIVRVNYLPEKGPSSVNHTAYS